MTEVEEESTNIRIHKGGGRVGVPRNFLQRLFSSHRARRHAEYQEWFLLAQQAHQWERTPVLCWACETPAPSEVARFCSYCGAPINQPSGGYQPQEYTTDPMGITERPFLAFVRETHTDTGPHTERHRSIRLTRLGDE